jgi:hypothetical protein
MHDLESQAGLKRRKLLLKWVCCTIVLWLVNISDYALSIVPTYYFWRGILFPLMIFDGTLATKILMSFETHIETVEKWVDRIVHSVFSVYNLAYLPAFTVCIRKLDFVVNGASPEQLDCIEKLIKSFRNEIKKVKDPLMPKKAELSPREPIKPKKKPATITRTNTSSKLWKAEVKLLKTNSIGKKSFYPHTISFDTKMKKLTWTAAGDDISNSDTLVGVRIRDNSKHILEIQLEKGNKTFSFGTTEELESWAKFLATQC